MKKIFSVILCLGLIFTSMIFTASAEDALPESEHNYSDNFYGEWFYQGDTAAKGLLICVAGREEVKDTTADVMNALSRFEA